MRAGACLSLICAACALFWMTGCSESNQMSSADKWRSEFDLAFASRQKNDLKSAEEHYRAALAALDGETAADDRKARTLMELAELLGGQGRYDQSGPMALVAVNVLDQLWEPKAGSESQQATGRLLLKALNLAARTSARQGKTSEAEALFKRGLAVDEAIVAPIETRHELITGYADMLRGMGRREDARELVKSTKHTDSSLTPDESRDRSDSSWKTLDDAAGSALKGANYANAERLYRQAVKRAGKEEDKKPKAARSLLGLASVYDAQGRYSDAMPLAEEALKTARACHEAGDKELTHYVTRLAGIHAHVGAFSKALPLYEEALKLRLKSRSPHWAPDTRRVMDSLADVYTKAGQHDKALRLLRDKLEIERQHYGEDSIKILMTSVQIADTLSSSGKLKEAAATYRFVSEKDAVVRKLDPRDLIKMQEANGRVLRKLGREKEALKAEREAKAFKDELLEDFGGR